MSLYYSQTLIPRDPDFVPPVDKVSAFLSALNDLGVMSSEPSLVLRVPNGKSREVPNPFTGGNFVIELKDHHKLESLEAFEKIALRMSDYEIDASTMGRPKRPPIAIDFQGPYCLDVTCIVSSKLRSTSDYHKRPGSKENVVPYGKPCDQPSPTGFFSNPHTQEKIEVRDAGCAHFWVQFQLGKNLFPKIEGCNLELLDPAIVDSTESILGVKFVQGCCWG
jgi:hypothetical protein